MASEAEEEYYADDFDEGDGQLDAEDDKLGDISIIHPVEKDENDADSALETENVPYKLEFSFGETEGVEEEGDGDIDEFIRALDKRCYPTSKSQEEIKISSMSSTIETKIIPKDNTRTIINDDDDDDEEDLKSYLLTLNNSAYEKMNSFNAEASILSSESIHEAALDCNPQTMSANSEYKDDLEQESIEEMLINNEEKVDIEQDLSVEGSVAEGEYSMDKFSAEQSAIHNEEIVQTVVVDDNLVGGGHHAVEASIENNIRGLDPVSDMPINSAHEEAGNVNFDKVSDYSLHSGVEEARNNRIGVEIKSKKTEEKVSSNPRKSTIVSQTRKSVTKPTKPKRPTVVDDDLAFILNLDDDDDDDVPIAHHAQLPARNTKLAKARDSTAVASKKKIVTSIEEPKSSAVQIHPENLSKHTQQRATSPAQSHDRNPTQLREHVSFEERESHEYNENECAEEFSSLRLLKKRLSNHKPSIQQENVEQLQSRDPGDGHHLHQVKQPLQPHKPLVPRQSVRPQQQQQQEQSEIQRRETNTSRKPSIPKQKVSQDAPRQSVANHRPSVAQENLNDQDIVPASKTGVSKRKSQRPQENVERHQNFHAKGIHDQTPPLQQNQQQHHNQEHRPQEFVDLQHHLQQEHQQHHYQQQQQLYHQQQQQQQKQHQQQQQWRHQQEHQRLNPHQNGQAIPNQYIFYQQSLSNGSPIKPDQILSNDNLAPHLQSNEGRDIDNRSQAPMIYGPWGLQNVPVISQQFQHPLGYLPIPMSSQPVGFAQAPFIAGGYLPNYLSPSAQLAILPNGYNLVPIQTSNMNEHPVAVPGNRSVNRKKSKVRKKRDAGRFGFGGKALHLSPEYAYDASKGLFSTYETSYERESRKENYIVQCMLRKLEELSERERARESIERSRQQQYQQQQQRNAIQAERRRAAQDRAKEMELLAKQKKLIGDAESAAELIAIHEQLAAKQKPKRFQIQNQGEQIEQSRSGSSQQSANNGLNTPSVRVQSVPIPSHQQSSMRNAYTGRQAHIIDPRHREGNQKQVVTRNIAQERIDIDHSRAREQDIPLEANIELAPSNPPIHELKPHRPKPHEAAAINPRNHNRHRLLIVVKPSDDLAIESTASRVPISNVMPTDNPVENVSLIVPNNINDEIVIGADESYRAINQALESSETKHDRESSFHEGGYSMDGFDTSYSVDSFQDESREEGIARNESTYSYNEYGSPGVDEVIGDRTGSEQRVVRSAKQDLAVSQLNYSFDSESHPQPKLNLIPDVYYRQIGDSQASPEKSISKSLCASFRSTTEYDEDFEGDQSTDE